MPQPNERPSLTTTLDVRYAKQHAGGAFEVKEVLGAPDTSPSAGTTIDATSLQGENNQSPNGFWVKVLQGVSQFKAVQTGGAGNSY